MPLHDYRCRACGEEFEELVRDWLRAYGYRPIRMPMVEPTPLFARAIGEVTDIVEKEMYSFIDSLNGEPLTLRPEGTAGCVRAVIQHNLIAVDGDNRSVEFIQVRIGLAK